MYARARRAIGARVVAKVTLASSKTFAWVIRGRWGNPSGNPRCARAHGAGIARCGSRAIVAALVRADASAAVEPAVDCPGVPFSTSLADETGAQVLVDFSGAAGFDSALELALERKLALVSGSTGLSGRQSASLLAASERIPVLWAANFSLGVAVLAHVAAEASRLLPDWDCEILEAHHRNKQDAPSGTALMLGERVRGARGTGEPLLPAAVAGHRLFGDARGRHHRRT